MSKPPPGFRQLLRKGLDQWYLFVLFLALALLAAYLFLQFTAPKYEAKAMLLVKDDEGQLNEQVVFYELGLGKMSKNLENEILVLKSTPLMYEVVEKLELNNDFTELDGFHRRSLYKTSPIRVLEWQPPAQYKKLEGVLHPEGSGRFTLDTEEGKFSGAFGKPLQLQEGSITLIKTGEGTLAHPVEMEVRSVWDAATELCKRFHVEAVGERSSVVQLSMKDVAPERAKDILTHLIEAYNNHSLQLKNRIFENSIQFIDERFKLIAGELSESESDVEDYKRKYNVVELSTEGNMLLNELSKFNKQISDSEVQLEILTTIQHFLQKNRENFEFVPTNLALNNLTLAKQLDQFNTLLMERDRLKSDLGTSHPEWILTETQLRNLRQTIINNIYSIKKDLEISGKANDQLKQNMEARLQSLPKRERELIDIERKKDIKEKLYTYLMQKREEAAISLAVSAAPGQVVEPPSYGEPVSPRPAQIWLIAAFLGLALPVGLLFLLESLHDKIQDESEILDETNVPVLGVLAKTRGRDKLVARENNFGVSAEMFRLLRSNLSQPSHKNLRTLLITSSIYGEGKSYIALNLAMTQVLVGKRVVIVDLDFRKKKPELYGSVAAGQFGVTDYLMNPAMTPQHLIHNSALHACLDIVHRGAVVPNPSQMVHSARLRELIHHLRQEYDFIILDAPPVGLITDTLEMNDLADATMYVVRAGKTQKNHLQIIENIRRMEKLPAPFIVLNGVRMNSSFHYANVFKAQNLSMDNNGNGVYVGKKQALSNN